MCSIRVPKYDVQRFQTNNISEYGSNIDCLRDKQGLYIHFAFSNPKRTPGAKGGSRIVHWGKTEGPRAGIEFWGGAATPFPLAKGSREGCELP